MTAPEIIAVCSLVLNVIIALVGFTWGLSKIASTIEEKILMFKEKIDLEIDAGRREVGEVVTAIRTKIHDVELYMRDNYVRRDTFTKLFESMQKDMQNLGERIFVRLERMERKIDLKKNDGEDPGGQ